MRLSTAFVALLAASAAAQTQEERALVLPVKKVVLYKHGLGYFERSGKVEGSGVVSLRFSAGQMNDVLKSLTALDLDGGRVSTIGYDSQAPAARLLGDFGFELPREGAIVALLKMFRGAQVEVNLGGKVVTGSVVGVEPRQVAAGDKVAEVQRVTLLTSDGSAVSFDAVEVQAVKFLDKELSDDVRRYLEILRDSYRAERKSMQLRLEGSGQREVDVSYTVEVPVWKASYRLVLRDKNLLQGWAIVDNTSDEDWNDVQLSLVAGLPVSFVQDLYTPRYTRRPVVEMAQELAVAPQTHEGGWDDKQKLADNAEEEKGKGGGGGGETRRAAAYAKRFAAPGAPAAADAAPAEGRSGGFAAEKARRGEALDATVAATKTWTREVGNLFEYRIDHPVTVKRNRSALIPIVGADVEAEKVSLYNQNVRARNPLSAVRFKNTSGLTLEGGPVTVLEDDVYAGEALVETLEPNEQRYLSYAVDLALTVDTKQESSEERVVRVRVLNGLLWADARVVATTGYTLRNGDEKPRKVVVEHPRRAGYTLTAKQKPLEETPEHWRFAVDVPAKKTVLFDVKEEFAQQNQWAVTNLSSDDVDLFVRRKLLMPDLEKALREVLAAKAEIADLERRSQAQNGEIAAIGQDQERLRKNMQALGSTSAEQQLKGRYVEQLQKSEDRITELAASKKKLDEQVVAKRTALDQRIRELAFDHALDGP
jgi:hypothetical protein